MIERRALTLLFIRRIFLQVSVQDLRTDHAVMGGLSQPSNQSPPAASCGTEAQPGPWP